MAERAQVSSIEAVEAFRTNLIVYLEKANRTLDEISDEIKRTRVWLESDRRVFWQHESKRRTRTLEEKQQALFSARLSSFREAYSAEQLAAQKAKRALLDAEEKLRKIRQWNRQFDSRVVPLAKEVDKLRDVLTHHMGQAVQYLTETTRTLAAYAEAAPARSNNAPPSALSRGRDDEIKLETGRNDP